MQSPEAEIDRLENLLDQERRARLASAEASEHAWRELSVSLRGLVRELTETRLFLENIVASSTEYSIIGKDLDRNVLLWNEGARRNYGYTEDEVVGKPSDFLHAEEDLKSGNVAHLHEKALVDGKAEGQFLRKRKDGSTFHASVVITRREDADGNPIGFLLISRDITKDIELEERRASEERLRQERRAALESNQAKSVFLADMSHELRTPLNSIIGFTQLMLRERSGPLTDRQREHLGYVASSADHLLRIINDALDLAKVEAGHIDLRPEDVDVRTLATELLSGARLDAEPQEIELHLDVEDDLPPIRIDPGRLRQVLYNFLSNAVKFSPHGGHVWLTITHEENHIRFAVRDQGLGIAPKDQERLFRPFEQVHSPELAVAGSGLGLALTRRIVEAQGGRVGLESEPGKGSTFWALIPTAQPNPPTTTSADEVRIA